MAEKLRAHDTLPKALSSGFKHSSQAGDKL